MVSDIYGGLTNNKIQGGSSHDKENYWYDSNGNITHFQLREAWAEYFSAQINKHTWAIEQNKTYFPTATEELDQLADEILRYYQNMYQ